MECFLKRLSKWQECTSSPGIADDGIVKVDVNFDTRPDYIHVTVFTACHNDRDRLLGLTAIDPEWVTVLELSPVH